jgi:HD superfamily phosphodiesterase
MWRDLHFEDYVKERLKESYGSESAETWWASYIVTRDNLTSSILPFIAKTEPNLTDHGVDHIANVIENAAQILGVPAPSSVQKPISGDLNPKELLLLLLACLLHDVGNIVGREQHNEAVPDVWRNSGASSKLWAPVDRRTVVDVCRAHTGRGLKGDFDTLEPLSREPRYFLKGSVRAATIAAIVRFADELAEGPQRTSQFLLSTNAYPEKSLPYHTYASATHVTIDRAGTRIALNYDIDLSQALFAGADRRVDLEKFLCLMYRRILKLERERVFARHYAPQFVLFRETSVAIHFSDERGANVDLNLPLLVLNDFNARGDSLDIITKLSSKYDVSAIAQSIFPNGDSK